jgi:hypothetical protein
MQMVMQIFHLQALVVAVVDQELEQEILVQH